MGTVGGSMLGRYEVIRHLASGGMADLLLARARGLEGFERHVVIKRIRADVENDQAFIDMFLVEARLAGALHHHNIVQVHDVGEENGKPYFAMEYVHGEDLRRLLALVAQKNEQIPFSVAVTIVTSVARALHHAHEQRGADQQTLGIVHRDVSPANIVVGYDGNVKVLDFGIARAAMRRTETQAGMLKGKAPYMAPEQCTGAPVDRRSDVFGLGIVLYELVTARRLFKADNDFSTMSMVVNGSFPKPSTIRKDLPPDLERVILRALARDPGARYQTAEQMFTALEQLALTAEWRTSASSLAAYMTQVFGTRTEPWLDKEPIAPAVSVDFDGTRPGLASAPAEADKSAVSSVIATPASAPIMRARSDAQGSNGVPTTGDAGVSNGVRIPEASGPTKSSKVPLKPVPANPSTARARPKTVQVPVVKSAAVTEALPTVVAGSAAAAVAPVIKATSTADTVVLPTTKSSTTTAEVLPMTKAGVKTEVVVTKVDIQPDAKVEANVGAKPAAKIDAKPAAKVASASSPAIEAKPDAKVDAKPVAKVDAKPAAQVDAKPAAKVEPKPAAQVDAKPAAKVEPAPAIDASPSGKVEPKPLRPLSKLPAKTEAKVPVRAAAEEQAKPIVEPEDTHTEAMPLPPAISPHAARQLKPLPLPNGAKPIAAKPGGPVQSELPALRPAAPGGDAASEPGEANDPDVDLDGPTEISSADEAPFGVRRGDPTELVEPLPSPLVNDAPPRARRNSTVPLATMTVVESTDQLAAPARPRWMVPAIGGGLVVLVIIVIAIARSGGDPALDEAPATASIPEPTQPTPSPAAAPVDEVRTEARPRTWANSQPPDPAGSAAAADPAPSVATPEPAPTPDPVAVEPTPAPAPGPVAVAPTPEPTPDPASVADPVAVDPTPPDPDPTTDPKPTAAATKPTPKPVTKPTPKPTSKPAPKAVAVAKAKPAPKPTAVAKPKPKPTGKALPTPKWNPNTLFPNKK